MEVSSIMI